MKGILMVILFFCLCLTPLGTGHSLFAGQIDMLINKLVEKGILTASEAKELIQDLQQEGAREEATIKEVATETAKEVVKEESEKGSFELPSWVKKIKPFGDLRLRHDSQWKDYDTSDSTRNRERFRLRFGVKSQVTDSTEVGIRLASGSGFQNTTNQSFDSHGRGKNIFIDRAYAKWKANKNFTLLGGKVKNHLFTTPLVWDPDVNPEGLSEALNYRINDKFSLFANFEQWFIEEISSTNDDPTLLAFQLGTEVKPKKNMKLQFGATYYEYLKMDRIKYDIDDIRDTETFLGYNNKYGQQMVFDSAGELLNEWGCLELGAKFSVKELLPVPFSVFGDYIVNFDADIDELTSKGVAYASTDPADLLAYGSDDRDMGWLVGFSLGNKKKKKDWYMKYHYQVLEDYAFPAVFVDSDFHGGGTNNQGHYIHGRYFITDKIQARATGFITERENESKDGKFDENRIQLDIVIDFP
ncbi:MAG: putative porin [Deltaproteobacteria bacterium]|nr:putative porin [Deltaproteobacteria bacterium]MBW2202209.1 putative porin [Deltaproteobacteria bacterium]